MVRTKRAKQKGALDPKQTEVELQRLGLAGLPGGNATRLVHHNTEFGHPRHFATNSVTTAKYNVATFLPRFLFEVFSQVAYFYFLIQACLVWWSVVSPYKPYGPLIALIFVVGVAAIKAIIEDRKRHQEDAHLNNSICHVMEPDGSIRDIKWSQLKVGEVLKVYDDEDFPADLLCLFCNLADNVCYIKTTNLDGETNLKVRRPLDAKEFAPTEPEQVGTMRVTVAAEPPNANLHSFVGKAVLEDDAKHMVPVSINELLLRGCTLKNSGFILGIVIYTGAETRIQMNSTAPPRKQGSYTRFLNLQVLLLLILQLTLCAVCSAIAWWWRKNHGYDRFHLALRTYNQGNYRNGGVYWLVFCISFWLLFSYMIPISLFVTMEIVKAFQAYFIFRDPEMRDPDTRQWAKARNSNIIEDLGRAAYVFSDKTGTLTSNEMRLRGIAIKGKSYGSPDFRLEDHRADKGASSLRAFDRQLADAAVMTTETGVLRDNMRSGGSDREMLATGMADPSLVPNANPNDVRMVVLGHHMIDFWTNMCLNHNLITEGELDTEDFRYQGPSPDEVALVEGARQLGFEFRGRTRTHATISFLGQEQIHKVLVELEFTSERARASVVTQAPDGTIRLMCKGSDAVMLPRIRPGTDRELLEATDRNLHAFSVKGLRTLVVATKVLTPEEWQAWFAVYLQAASSLEDREARIAAAAERLETNFELIGVTAIEDKLQEGVPDAIAALIEAGLRVWMITGDKQETAINIGISCGLIHDPQHLLICNAPTAETAAPRLHELAQRTMGPAKDGRLGGELVIDGKTLTHILETDVEPLLASIAASCSSVIVCRASPSQKARIVRMMMDYELKTAEQGRSILPGALGRWARRYKRRMENKMLAIGDGANDVAMIQTADIGVGIMGKEGRQAVNNSDYAIGQFRFLVRLLMVHGGLSVYRISRLIKYSFYKNIAFAFILFYYQFFSGWSAQALVDGYTAAFYNAFFTALPIGIFAVVDRPFRHLDTFMRFPQLYNRHQPLTAFTFWKTGILLGILHAAIVFFVIYFSVIKNGRDSSDDLYSMGKTMFVALIGVVELEIALITRFWTKIYFLVWALSFVCAFPFLIILPLAEKVFGLGWDVTTAGVGVEIMSQPLFWLQLILIYLFAFGSRLLDRSARVLFVPNDNEIVQEIERRIDVDGGKHATTSRLHRLSAVPPPLNLNGTANGTKGTNGMNGNSSFSPNERPDQSKGPLWRTSASDKPGAAAASDQLPVSQPGPDAFYDVSLERVSSQGLVGPTVRRSDDPPPV